MERYLAGVMFLNFLVDSMLAWGASRLCGVRRKVVFILAAAALGGVYSGACMMEGFAFLGNPMWRLIILVIMSAAAFGLHISSIRPGAVFILLRLALGGIAAGFERQGWGSFLISGLIVCGLCLLGRSSANQANYVPVELSYNGKKLNVMALEDTGNSLKDPITGDPVLVVGQQTAQQLTGLSAAQLQNPIHTMGQLPGLRLIPYHTIGKENGLLLGMRLPDVKIGTWRGSHVVAFAPAGLGQEEKFQALTGGAV